MDTFNQHKAIADSLRYLSSVCDGALAQDGAGFNGLDAAFGHSLARQSQHGGLTVKQETSALRMLRKYHAQLARVGISLDAPVREVSHEH